MAETSKYGPCFPVLDVISAVDRTLEDFDLRNNLKLLLQPNV